MTKTRKIFCTVMFMICTWMLMFPTSASAADESMHFSYALSIDGKDTVEVTTGDVITVTLTLTNKDASSPYIMYAMQDEIRYDGEFFELVEGTGTSFTDVVTNDIADVDQHREYYMNYLSMIGGTQWEPSVVIGTFQLRVKGTAGVSTITNQDYLVSLADGSDSYACEANELTVIVTTDCTVRFMTNGGTPVEDQIVQYGEKIKRPEDPIREGYYLEGWYTDIHLTDEWDFENDTVKGNMSLYAKWTEEAPIPEPTNDFPWWIVLILAVAVIYFGYRKVKSNPKN